MITDVSLPQDASWGDTLRAYRAKTSELPWAPGSFQPNERVTNFVKKRQDREFNPMLMTYTSSEREFEMRREEDGQRAQQRMHARTRRMRQSHGFDIVSNQPALPRENRAATASATMRGGRGSSVNWNIVSNFPQEQHNKLSALPPNRNGPFPPPVIAQPLDLRESNNLPASCVRRDFDVLSNKYNEDHEERTAEQTQRIKEEITKKYWSTHDYNFIAGVAYDQEQEDQYQNQLKLIRKVHGTSKHARLPPSVQYAEGSAYNIISHDVVSDEKNQMTQSVKDRGLHSRVALDVEKRLKRDGSEEFHRAETMRMNRPNYERWGSTQRGFDMITNESNIWSQPQPSVKPKQTPWARLQQSAMIAAAGARPCTTPMSSQMSHRRMPSAQPSPAPEVEAPAPSPMSSARASSRKGTAPVVPRLPLVSSGALPGGGQPLTGASGGGGGGQIGSVRTGGFLADS